ncbi:MAG: outer membrane lipoprotein chaperone LolA [Candidatus Methylomirabilales bacterium]
MFWRQSQAGRRRAAAAGLLLLGVCAASARAAAAPSAAEVAEKVRAACAGMTDLSAAFQQTATNRSLGQVQEASGQLLLKRPGKMRWEYQRPDPRLYVTDGKTLWAYNPTDKQVVVQEVEAAFTSRLPLAFLAGDCQLGKTFQVSLLEHAGTRTAPDTALLDLRPKQVEAGIARMVLEVGRKTGLVEKATLFDAAGNTTVIALRDIKLNTGLRDQQFSFSPPAGTTVVKP